MTSAHIEVVLTLPLEQVAKLAAYLREKLDEDNRSPEELAALGVYNALEAALSNAFAALGG